jgi:uncharacterized membrane protein YedE/YeeE
MQNPQISRVMNVGGVILVLALVAAFLADRDMGWIMVVPVVGGVIAASVLIVSRRSGLGASQVRPDPFEHSNTDVINVSHIRVAGVGGIGLMAVAAAMAVTFPRIGWSVVVSAIAGVALAVTWILMRRDHEIKGSR